MRSWRPTNGAYWPSTRFAYAGPVFAEFDLPVPSSIEQALQGPGPHVYVALTSVPAKTVRQVVRGVAASGANVIVAATVHELADLAGPRITVAGVLPSHKIMPRVDLAVTTGTWSCRPDNPGRLCRARWTCSLRLGDSRTPRLTLRLPASAFPCRQAARRPVVRLLPAGRCAGIAA